MKCRNTVRRTTSISTLAKTAPDASAGAASERDVGEGVRPLADEPLRVEPLRIWELLQPMVHL